MVPQKRMSALTAMVLGVAAVLTVAIASGSAVVAYTLHVAGGNASALVGFAENTVHSLPDLIDSLPAAVGDALHDRRDPAYASDLKMDVKFVANTAGDRYRPVLTVTNGGTEVVSMLAIHVAALDESGVPVGEWTEIVATPIALDDNDWRGPLLPGSPRHVIVGAWRGLGSASLSALEPVAEISDVRVWLGADAVPVRDRVAATDRE